MHTGKETPTVLASRAGHGLSLSSTFTSVQTCVGFCWLGGDIMLYFVVFIEILPGVEAAQEHCEDPC